MPMITNNGDAALQLANAMSEGTPEEQAEALRSFSESIAQSVREDYEALASASDQAALAARGIRQLTTAEQRFYDGLTQALRSDAPQQAFAEFLSADGDDFMPETIIEDVYKNLEQDHELLQVIDFVYTGYATKWLRSKKKVAKAIWGSITGAITQEIADDFEWMNLDQGKLTAFAVVPLDIIDMGFQWVDAYVRRCLMEALYEGLEDGIVNGKGAGFEPVGLIRDIHHGVSISTSTGYPAKSAVALADFGPDYLAKVATMAKTEAWTEGEGESAKTYGGKNRKVPSVVFIANSKTMIGKVNAALLTVGPAGYMAGNPAHPTKFVECNALADNKAIMLVPGGYTCAIGGNRNGLVTFDDSFKFLEDARTFKAIQHAAGIAEDNTAALYVDVENVKAAALPVTVQGTVSTDEVA